MADGKVIRIDDGTTLRTYLGRVFESGYKSALAQKALTEKEKQDAVGAGGGDVDDLFGDGGGGGDDSGGDAPTPDVDDDSGDGDNTGSSKTMDDEKEKLQSGNIEPKDILDKLNSIRSGKSFKDSAVSSAMDEYIGSLAKPEKVALLAFLKGIAQIVTGEIPAQNAEDPTKHPADIKMDKSNEPHVTHTKPNVIKRAKHSGAGAPPEKAAKEAPAEDTSAPTPIVPKRR